MKSLLAMVLAAGAALTLSSCGAKTAPTTYVISGTISGLTSAGLVLQLNAGDNLSVPLGSTTFVFTDALQAQAPYTVTVLTQPSSPAETCTVTFGTGTISNDVTNVQVACADNTFTLGGTVSGLTGSGLVLQDNGGSNLTISSNGSFSFPTALNRGSGYNVTVLTQPSNPAQTCGVSNGYGAGIFGNVTNVLVSCITTTTTYTIGGTVSGLAGSGLVLQNNSGNNLAVSANGSFTFATPVASGATYSVTVLTQPSSPSQNCVVTGGGGTATANVTGILVACTTQSFQIGGTITGLTASGLVLQDNGGDNLSVAANSTAFTFATPVASGATYAVTVLTQPSGQTCTVSNGTGTVGSGAVTGVTLACAAASNMAVSVSGLLPNTSVILQNNGGDNLVVSSSAPTSSFYSSVAGGSAYAVTVLAQPQGATCMIGESGKGTMTGAGANVAVTCGNIIAAGKSHTCAVSDGGVLCWGSNAYGQLGDGSTADSATPVAVSGLTSGVVSITSGDDSTCALTATGGVWCWGSNAAGQLGNGTLANSSVPLPVTAPNGNGALSGIAVISSGGSHTCAVTSTGGALCWGDNSSGQLGDGTSISSSLPISVSGMSSGAANIAAGADFTCAVSVTGQAACWGNGSASASLTPSAVVGAASQTQLSGVVTISAGTQNACALTAEGNVLCWGATSAAPIAGGSGAVASGIPALVQAVSGGSSGETGPTAVVGISSGLDFSCAIANGGATQCWGNGLLAPTVASSNTSSATPSSVTGLATDVVAIAVGTDHACAVSASGTVQCWGANASGQLGDGSTSSSASPINAVGTASQGALQVF